jgi:hypothetical protein
MTTDTLPLPPGVVALEREVQANTVGGIAPWVVMLGYAVLVTGGVAAICVGVAVLGGIVYAVIHE